MVFLPQPVAQGPISVSLHWRAPDLFLKGRALDLKRESLPPKKLFFFM